MAKILNHFNYMLQPNLHPVSSINLHQSSPGLRGVAVLRLLKEDAEDDDDDVPWTFCESPGSPVTCEALVGCEDKEGSGGTSLSSSRELISESTALSDSLTLDKFTKPLLSTAADTVLVSSVNGLGASTALSSAVPALPA